MKEADKTRGVSSFCVTDDHFSVATDIEKDANLPVFAAYYNDRLFADDQGFKVPR
jgi:hypothetical protein